MKKVYLLVEVETSNQLNSKWIENEVKKYIKELHDDIENVKIKDLGDKVFINL